MEKVSGFFKTCTEVLAEITGNKYIQIEILGFYPSYTKTFDISCFSSILHRHTNLLIFALMGFKFSNKADSNICGEGSFSNTVPYKNKIATKRKRLPVTPNVPKALYFCDFSLDRLQRRTGNLASVN